MLFNSYDNLKYAAHSKDGRSIWSAVLEKAWAKMKNNYIAAEVDAISNAHRALTGAPSFMYNLWNYDSISGMNYPWEVLTGADESNYIMNVGTLGNSDTTYNDCGIPNNHAYSIVATFTMSDNGQSHRCLLINNPWASTGWN